jgi:hypothetical protein
MKKKVSHQYFGLEVRCEMSCELMVKSVSEKDAGNKQGFRQSRRCTQQETRTFPTNFCVHRTLLLPSFPFIGFFPVKSADHSYCTVFPALQGTLSSQSSSVVLKQFYNLFVWRQIPTEKIGKNAGCKNLIFNTVTCAVFSTTLYKNYGIILTED